MPASDADSPVDPVERLLARIAATRDVVLGVGQATALGDRPRLARGARLARRLDSGRRDES